MIPNRRGRPVSPDKANKVRSVLILPVQVKQTINAIAHETGDDLGAVVAKHLWSSTKFRAKYKSLFNGEKDQ